MDYEIRPAAAAEMEDFVRCVRTGFGLPAEFKLDLDPAWTLCAFSQGHLATSYAAWPLTMYLEGATVPVAGITMVATLPVYRRRNFLRKVTEAHFRRLHEEGGPSISALFASMAAIYQRYGYAAVSTRNGYSVEPQHLRFTLPLPESGEFQEAGEADQRTMLDLYHRFASGKTGYLRRGEGMLVAPGHPMSVLHSMPPALPAIKLIYRQAGEPQGYLIYSQVRDPSINPMGQRISVMDLVWLTPSAYQAIWGLLSRMDLVSRIDWLRAPPDDPLPHLLLEPRKLNATSADGLLARIVDVERALPQRRYTGEAELTFSLLDSVCPWNQGPWKLSVSPHGNRIVRTTEEAQLKMPVSTLAMLFFGQITATQAAAMGRLDEGVPGSLAVWDVVMKTASRPFCADSF
jgi:predicted acetyltransferase